MKKHMKASTIEWHLQRDSCLKLAKFCDKNQIERVISDYYMVEDQKLFKMTTFFNNGGYIEAELQVGESIANYYQVVSYSLGA